jgi:predicted nucleic acid binding AN1-type Zn finger protein
MAMKKVRLTKRKLKDSKAGTKVEVLCDDAGKELAIITTEDDGSFTFCAVNMPSIY